MVNTRTSNQMFDGYPGISGHLECFNAQVVATPSWFLHGRWSTGFWGCALRPPSFASWGVDPRGAPGIGRCKWWRMIKAGQNFGDLGLSENKSRLSSWKKQFKERTESFMMFVCKWMARKTLGLYHGQLRCSKSMALCSARSATLTFTSTANCRTKVWIESKLWDCRAQFHVGNVHSTTHRNATPDAGKFSFHWNHLQHVRHVGMC